MRIIILLCVPIYIYGVRLPFFDFPRNAISSSISDFSRPSRVQYHGAASRYIASRLDFSTSARNDPTENPKRVKAKDERKSRGKNRIESFESTRTNVKRQ